MNWIKRLLNKKREARCIMNNTTPSPLHKIIINYETDLDNPNWNLNVMINDKKVGYCKRGYTFGFWFISKMGQDIHADSIDSLKNKVFREFENYRRFFNIET